MRVWLLQSRRGGRTCGHLHVRESGAWRCRDTQAEPSAWSVVSTFLSDAEGARPRPDWGSVIACTGMVVLALGMVAGSLAALVWGFRSGDLWAVGAGGFGASASLLLMALWGKSLVDDFRNPTPYGGGWEWF